MDGGFWSLLCVWRWFGRGSLSWSLGVVDPGEWELGSDSHWHVLCSHELPHVLIGLLEVLEELHEVGHFIVEHLVEGALNVDDSSFTWIGSIHELDEVLLVLLEPEVGCSHVDQIVGKLP